MNTTKHGDEFERKALAIIKDALDAGKLGIYGNQCTVFAKKGYYSRDRESDIIFDLAIEVWPPGAKNYTLLFFIECKSYSHAVPVSDIEEFHDKIGQVAGVNAKGIFIANSDCQRGVVTYARSKARAPLRSGHWSSSSRCRRRPCRGSPQTFLVPVYPGICLPP